VTLKRYVFVVALVSLLATSMYALSPWASYASHADLRDRNDQRGPLDVRAVGMSSGNQPSWTIRTWDRWSATSIWDRGFLALKYDTFGDSHFDYYALIRSDGFRLRGTLHRDYKRQADEQLRRLATARPDRASVRVKVPLGAMRFDEEFVFRWTTATTWLSGRCEGGICLDRAPNKGAVEEPRRPVPTPTLTVSPTPTPTPSDTDL